VPDYYHWHLTNYPEAESKDDYFNPLHLGEWYNSTFHQPLQSTKPVPESFEARLTRVFPANSPVIFSVLPCELPDRIAWLDAAGYMLAESNKPSIWHDTLANKRDFYLDIRQRSIVADEF
jgi:hypothetical protein